MGILYPKAGRVYGAHFRLAWQLKQGKLDNVPAGENDDWAALLAEIEASPHQKAVISAEGFSFRCDPERLAFLKDRFDVRVVYYLRSPDSFMESFYNQFVKDFNSRENRTLDIYLLEEDPHFLDPMRALGPWARLFGDDAIKLRIFDKAHLRDGILTDFLGVLGITDFPEFAPPNEGALQKVSLPPDALEYLRLSNPWLTREEGHHPFVVSLVRIAQEHRDELQQTRAGILSHKARVELRRRYRPRSAEAATRFLGMDRTPFPPGDAPQPPADFSQRFAEATPEIFGRVAAMIRNTAET